MASRFIAVVATPLQLLNVREYLAHAGAAPSTCEVWALVGAQAGRSGVSQMAATAQAIGWEPARQISIPIDHRARRWVIDLGTARRLAASLDEDTVLIVGNTTARAMRIAANAHAGRCVVVDDGAATAVHAAHRARAWQAAPSWQVPGFRRAIVGERLRMVTRPVEWFSMFPIEHLPFDRLDRNHLPVLRDQMRSRPRTARRRYGNLFLGQPLVEDGVLGEERYRSALARAIEARAGTWLYVPHRRERAVAVRERVDALGLATADLGLPVELAVLAGDVEVDAIVSVASSALATCGLLFAGDGVQVLRLPLDDLVDGHETKLADDIAVLESVAGPFEVIG